MMGRRLVRRHGGGVLTLSCFGQDNVVQLDKVLGKPLKLYSVYSDSELDNSLLSFCVHRFGVSP